MVEAVVILDNHVLVVRETTREKLMEMLKEQAKLEPDEIEIVEPVQGKAKLIWLESLDVPASYLTKVEPSQKPN